MKAQPPGATHRRWIAGASALFIAAMVAGTAHGLWTARIDARHQAEQEIIVLSRVLAEQTRRSLQTVDVVLREIGDAQRAGQLPPPGSTALRDYLDDQRSPLGDVVQLFLADAAGHPRAAGAPIPAAVRDLAGQRAFQQLQASPAAGTVVGHLFRPASDGPWLLPVLQRVENKQGGFDGCVVALFDASAFARFYAGAGLGAGHVVSLLDGEGTLVAREPPHEQALGASAGAWTQGLDTLPPLPRRFLSHTDHVERLGVTQPVPGYALHVAVARDTALVFAAWREAAWGSVLRTALLCAAALGLVAVVLQQLRRLEAARRSLAQSEQQLRISEERYALAVAGANEGLWDWDLASDEVFFSPRAQQACGLRPGDPQRPRRDWLAQLRYHPEDRPRVRQALVRHLQGHTPQYDVEMRLAVPGGTADAERDADWSWVRQRGLLVRDDQGRPRRMAGSIEDITGRKRAEAQREQLEVRLRTAQKLEALGTLAGGIAHDFNNILGAILGYAELAQAQAAPGSPLQQQLDGVTHAGLRAKSLVQRILAFSRSGLGERQPVHVQSVVEEALDQLEAALPAGIGLRRELRAGDAALVGDPAQVHQVVMNLLTNAVQACSAPAEVRVSLAPRTLQAPLQATSGALEAGEVLALEVRDPGRGIAPALLERIFDPFFTTREVGVGTGLGLSLVHGIVAELKGAIDVRSEPGAGSSFTVLLPWEGRVTPHPRRHGQSQAALPRGEGQRVLLVDDEAALVALGEETLAALGYEPVGYSAAVAALQAFEQAPQAFDAVLSDEAMPQLTGSELAAAVRRLRPEVPVLLMSGYVTPALAARAQAAGVRAVLSKPLVARDIAQALAGVLDPSVRTDGETAIPSPARAGEGQGRG